MGARGIAVVAKLAGLAVAAAVLLKLPDYVSEFRSFQFAYVGIYFIALLGLNILTGYTGQISLGHGAFLAIGGYTTAILVSQHGLWDLWTIPLAGLVSGLFGLLFGLPALRLSGLYLALATFAVAVATPAVLKRAEGLTGGGGGIVLDLPAAPFGLDLTPERWLYYLSWGIAALLFLLAWAVLRGRAGRAFRAIRDSEVAAASSGVNLAFYKTLAFGLSAFYAGIAGSLLVIAVAFASPDTFPLTLSLTLLVGVAVGGLGSLLGVVFGALFVQFMPIYAQEISNEAPAVIYGAALVLVMLAMPTGAAGLMRKLATPLRARLNDR